MGAVFLGVNSRGVKLTQTLNRAVCFELANDYFLIFGRIRITTVCKLGKGKVHRSTGHEGPEGE